MSWCSHLFLSVPKKLLSSPETNLCFRSLCSRAYFFLWNCTENGKWGLRKRQTTLSCTWKISKENFEVRVIYKMAARRCSQANNFSNLSMIKAGLLRLTARRRRFCCSPVSQILPVYKVCSYLSFVVMLCMRVRYLTQRRKAVAPCAFYVS